MDAASSSSARGAQQTRPTRIQPTRTRRGVVGFGNNEIDQQILDNMERRGDGEPHIPLDTPFFLTTNPHIGSPSDGTTSSGIQINSLANERYFERPDVIKAYREQQTIQIPEFVRIDELPEAGSRFRPRADLGDFDSDAVYEKRHRKYENFEKRIRMREKEKLKHEQYKLKERLEQIRGMDPQAFLALPASVFTPVPTTGDNSGEHEGEEDEEVAIYSSVPGAPVSGVVLHEGQRRRSEIVAAAEALAERYRVLLAPEKKKYGTSKDTPEVLSARPSIARTETDAPRTPIPTPLNRLKTTPSSSKARRVSVATEASEASEGPVRKRRKLAPSDAAPPSSPATFIRTPSTNESAAMPSIGPSSKQSTEPATMPYSVPRNMSPRRPSPIVVDTPDSTLEPPDPAPTRAPPSTPMPGTQPRDDTASGDGTERPAKKQRTEANGPKPISRREDSHPPIAVIANGPERARKLPGPSQLARPAPEPRVIFRKAHTPPPNPAIGTIASTSQPAAQPAPAAPAGARASASPGEGEAPTSADLPSVSRPSTPAHAHDLPGPSSLASGRPPDEPSPVAFISTATAGRGRGRGQGGARGGRPRQVASALDHQSASASAPPGAYRPPPTCKIAQAAARRSRNARQVTAFGSKVGGMVEVDADFDLPPWLWSSKQELDERILEKHAGLREWFEAKEKEEEEKDAEIEVEDDDEEEEGGDEDIVQGEEDAKADRQPSVPKWELDPEDEGEDEVDEMDDDNEEDEDKVVRIQAKPVKRRPAKTSKAPTANGKASAAKSRGTTASKKGKTVPSRGKNKAALKPLQKRIKLLMSNARSEQEEDELESEEDVASNDMA